MIVSPSLLAADPLNFESEMISVEESGADWHHVDVMDGHFVPNLTFGLPLIKALKKKSKLPLDVHIMVSNPDLVALDYVKAGADILTFHVEAAIHSHRIIQAIHNEGAKAGIAINPGTAVETLFPLIPYIDVIMFMSVNPGFGGQKYIPETADRIKRLADEILKMGRKGKIEIEVDGGITDQTVNLVKEAGATAVVAGSYVYGASDRKIAISNLKN